MLDRSRWVLPRVRAARETLWPLLFPADCFSCGAPLPLRQDLGACPSCWTGFAGLPRRQCLGCASPVAPETDMLGPARDRCARCLLDPPAPDSSIAAVGYDRHARRFLWRAKLGRRPELLEPLGRQLAQIARIRPHLSDIDAIIPVPSHPLRDLTRGFSPAAELARPTAALFGKPIWRRALRHRLTVFGATKKLPAVSRRQLRDRFVAGPRVCGRRILLIDDVLTTGSSSAGCARALQRAGAVRVDLLVWARAEAGSGLQ